MPRSATTFSMALLGVVCFGYGFLAYLGVLQNYGLDAALVTPVLTAAVLALQLGYFSRPRARHTVPRTSVALLALAGLVYLPTIYLGNAWVAFTGFFAGSLLISLPLPAGVAAAIGVAVGSSFFQGRLDPLTTDPLIAGAYSITMTLLTALVIFGLSRLAGLVRHLHDTREELSRLDVAEERVRFAQDVHDLLGMGLSTITLKTEVARRSLIEAPERCDRELEEVLAIARRAAAEARMVASGHTSLSLDEELRSAHSVLSAAEIDTSLRGQGVELAGEVSSLFAIFVRETVTNVLRHSKARSCQIAVSVSSGGTRIAVLNDGAEGSNHGAGERRSTPRHGIENLRKRFAERGGEVSVRHEDDEFSVVGVVPD